MGMDWYQIFFFVGREEARRLPDTFGRLSTLLLYNTVLQLRKGAAPSVDIRLEPLFFFGNICVHYFSFKMQRVYKIHCRSFLNYSHQM